MGNESSSEGELVDEESSVGRTPSEDCHQSTNGAACAEEAGQGSRLVHIHTEGASEQDKTGQSVTEVVRNLGALNESELWSLCRECMLALLKHKHELPVYISLDTVVIETDGHVTFSTVPDDKQLDAVYLAPELQEVGLITDKTCVFGVGAMLWSAADYKLPPNEEPALSEELECLLASMIQDEGRRPQVLSIMKSCNEYHEVHKISSSQACAGLITESKAAAYSKENTFIRDIMSQELQEKTLLHHAKVMESIKQAKLKLKPAKERQLADPPEDNSKHHRLMNEIRHGYSLRKVGRPKEYTARDFYNDHPHLLPTLAQVTGRPQTQTLDDTECKQDSAFTVIRKTPPRSRQEFRSPLRSKATVPEEYSSKATHFTPIEVSSQENRRPQQNLKSQFLTQKQSPSGKTSEIVKNIKELKQTILKMQGSRTLVQDLEKDAQREDSGTLASSINGTENTDKQELSQRSLSTSTSSDSSRFRHSQEEQPPRQNTSASQPYGVPMALPPSVFPVQYQLQQDPVTGLVNLVPVAFTQNVASISSPYFSGQPSQVFPLMGMPLQMSSSIIPPPPVQYQSTDGSRVSTEEKRDFRVEAENDSDRHDCHYNLDGSSQSTVVYPHGSDVSPRSAGRSEVASHLSLENRHEKADGEMLDSTKAEYPFSNCHPVRPRQVKAKDQMAKLKRAKSGSSIDYHQKMAAAELAGTDFTHGSNGNKASQPQQANLQDRVSRRRRHGGGASPDVLSSPSPSLSKDSGICGLNSKGFGDPALMEKLLNSNRNLSKIIKLLREEFTYDGYVENGVEDLAMAEYVMSLTNLSLTTFCGAITEKYSDLFWDEGLLLSLYEVVNDDKMMNESGQLDALRSSEPSPEDLDTRNNNKAVGGKNATEATEKSVTFSKARSTDEMAASYPRPQWVTNKHSMALHEDREQRDARQKWLSQRRGMDRSKSLDFDTVRDLSSATYLHNSCTDDASLRYPRYNSLVDSDPEEDASSKGGKESFDSLEMNDSRGSELQDDVILTSKSNSLTSRNQQNPRTCHSTYRIIRSHETTPQPNRGRAHSLTNVNSLQQYENSWRESGSSMLGSRSRLARSSGNIISSTDTDADGRQSPSTEKSPGVSVRLRRSEVAYYHADVDGAFIEKVTHFLGVQDSPSVDALEDQLYKVDQELMLLHRNRQKSLKYFLKLADFSNKTGTKGSDQKLILNRTTEELEKCQNDIEFLDMARKYLEMLYCDQWGLMPELLYSLAKCHGNCPMLLSPGDNPLLQFQTTFNEDSLKETKVLQAGAPLGLMAYLYAERSLSDGYIHEFFYCYRYAISPIHLLKFIINKYEAAVRSLSPDSEIPLNVKLRSLDLLYIWLDGYFRIDFQNSPNMMKYIEEFVEKFLPSQDPSVSDLVLLLEECKDGIHVDLVFSSNTPTFCNIDDSDAAPKSINVPRKWKSFKAALQLSAKSMKLQKLSRSHSVACIDRMNGMTRPLQDVSYERMAARHSDSIVLMDFSPTLLAEQLTLMEQELFQKSHPVHYLNSKAQGIGVDLTAPVILRAQPVNSRLKMDSKGNADNLFVGNHTIDDAIHVLIEHSQAIAFWIASEIINCKSSRIQVSLLCHLTATAKVCAELRNYATCLSILEGLQNPLVQHLPTWRNIPSKYRRMLDQLNTLQLAVKSHSYHLIEDDDAVTGPAIPSILLFILHVQREEIGGYTMANSMYKWSKLRTIARMVDQIRRFQQRMYDFQPDRVLQDIVRYRMQTFGGEDLAWVAVEQAQVHRQTKRKIPNVFQRMRQNFQSRKSPS